MAVTIGYRWRSPVDQRLLAPVWPGRWRVPPWSSNLRGLHCTWADATYRWWMVHSNHGDHFSSSWCFFGKKTMADATWWMSPCWWRMAMEIWGDGEDRTGEKFIKGLSELRFTVWFMNKTWNLWKSWWIIPYWTQNNMFDSNQVSVNKRVRTTNTKFGRWGQLPTWNHRW